MNFTIFSDVWEGMKAYVSMVKMIFTKDFIKERWHLHMGVSFLISLVAIEFLIRFAYLGDTPIGFHIFLGGFLLATINGVREWYLELTVKNPFDMRDVIMGSYGGILGAILIDLIHYL